MQLEHVYRHDGWILAAATAVREDNEQAALDIVGHQNRILQPSRRLNIRTLLEEQAAENYIEICWRRKTRIERNFEILTMAERVDNAGQPHRLRRQGRERVCCETSPPSWWAREELHLDAWATDRPGEPPRNGTLGWFDGRVIETDNGRRIRVVYEDGKRLPIVFARDLPLNPSRQDIAGRWLWNGGWCLTAHKAQGAQWPRVSIIDEYDRDDGEGRRRWLYTVMTRAREDLIWWRL